MKLRSPQAASLSIKRAMARARFALAQDAGPVNPRPPSANWKLVLAYDGTDFHGWQVQPAARTVQGELAEAILRVTGETTLPQGAGRTDAGVHARGQVASFPLAAAIPAVNLMRALNRTLPSSVCVLSAETVKEDFHARHSAVAKTYEYRVVVADPFAGCLCLPWQARFVYAIERPLHLDRMQEAAAAIVGTHDFTSFAAADPDRTQRLQQITGEPDPEANVRTILRSAWTQSEEPDALGMIIYRVTGDGFLHHMVRNLVGTFLEIGWAERPAAALPAILSARDRSAAGRTAPARGLFLDHVEYDAVNPGPGQTSTNASSAADQPGADDATGPTPA